MKITVKIGICRLKRGAKDVFGAIFQRKWEEVDPVLSAKLDFLWFWFVVLSFTPIENRLRSIVF